MAADEAFVTLATTDAYCMGAAVVGQSLRRHGTTRQTVVMVSPNVSREARLALEQVFDEVLLVDVLDSTDRTHLAWLGRPELGVTFTKLHCWTFTQYSKCVFLDADTLVLCNVDELFEREELSATPDPGWPDCFNSGVFVFRPSLDTHARLLEHARQHGSFDGGDQGLLNTFFSDWAVKDIRKHLPFVYNLSANGVYTYLPAYQQYGHNVRIVHFLGAVKPWHLRYNSQRGEDYLGQFVTLWWKEYLNHTSPLLTKTSQHSGPLRVRQETEAKAPFVEDLTHLLLSDLTLTSERPELSIKQREMGTQSEDTSSVNERGAAEWTDTQDPPVSVEGGDSGSEVTDTVTDTVSDANGGPATESTATEMEEDELEHRRMWEEGLADYLGKDSFDNIQKKLDRFLD